MAHAEGRAVLGIAVSEVAEWHRSAEGRAVLGIVAVSEVAEWYRSAEGSRW